MLDPVAQYQSSPFNGPFSENALLLDQVGVNNVEGLWVESKFLKSGNIEVSGTFSTIGIQLYGTNLDSVALNNQYILTVGGTITNNDVVTLTFKNANIPANAEPVAHTVVGADTTTTIATALAAAINADTKLQALGFKATSAAAIVTVNFPSVPSASFNDQPSQPSLNNFTLITAAITGGATETVGIAVGTSGTTIGSAISAAGFTALTSIPRYIKARLTTLTGSTPSINAALQGAG